jgi:hypothetical protein
MLPATFSCPRCKCHALYLPHRKALLDRLMSVLGLRPVRCMTCDKRFYVRHSRVKQYDSEAPRRTFAQSGRGEPGRTA